MKNKKINHSIIFIFILFIYFFLFPTNVYAKSLVNSDFGGSRNYFYRYGWCNTGYAATISSRSNVIGETEYVTRMGKGEDMSGYGIGYVGDVKYGGFNAYSAREIFRTADVWDPYTSGTVNFDNHGYHGSPSVLLNDGEVLPCYHYNGKWAEVKYNGARVWLPIFATTYTGTSVDGDNNNPYIGSQGFTSSYSSDSNRYSDSTEDFIFNFVASDSGSGINHLEYKVEQLTSSGRVINSYQQYSEEGPYNGNEQKAWNENVTATINLGKLYGITRITAYAYDGAGKSSSVNIGTFYVDRIRPNAPTYSFRAGQDRPMSGINDPFKLQIIYQDDIDTSNSSGEDFSGIREIYYYISQNPSYTPSFEEYTKVNSTTVGKNTHIVNIEIAETGNWYIYMRAVDYAGHTTDSKTPKPFVIAKINPSIIIEPDKTVDIGAYSTLKVVIHGLTEAQINNPETKVQIKFPTWWDEDSYMNNGSKYIFNNTIDTTKMIVDKNYVGGDKTYLYYFNFIPPMGILEGKTKVNIPIEVQIITPGFGYDAINTKLSISSTITLTIENTKNLSTYITDNA